MDDANGDSVLERLAREGAAIPPLRLAPEPSEAPSGVGSGGMSPGRYRVSDEIGRGGVGVVLRGFDPDLGRAVAIKVLREEHAQDASLVRRFVEEAQIGGQLQHPGIVPVYELGADGSDRPFFTMKLIKGRTLAALLSERPDARHDRRRFLAIFEAVCQTVAYAHARGVIHRDLKPANIMTGAFGEVLVVDWGMGKVLPPREARVEGRPSPPPQTLISTVRTGPAEPRSELGLLLGTPSYMPPEQALGELDRVDERSDVFALGATLCEILTGAPPYVGSAAVCLAAAQVGDMIPVFERIEASGADERLVALAKACLAHERSGRPRDASAVAQELAAYLSVLEERARRAEVEAARAQTERRARRLTVALAASFVALVALGAGGWWWTERERARRADDIDHAVAADLDTADALRLRAAAAPDDGTSLLREALVSTQGAERLALSPDGREATRTRAVTLRAAVEADLREAEGHRATLARDRAMVRRLEEIRFGRAEVWSSSLTSEAYQKAFAEFLGGTIEQLGPEEAARRIVASPVRDEVALGLEDWIAQYEFGARDAGPLLEVARRVDPQSWGQRLRAAGSDLARLRALAADSAWEAAPVSHLAYLSNRIGRAGDPERAAELAMRTWRRAPSDFWTCWEAGYWLSRTRPPRSEEAVRLYTAAVALRPESSAAHNNLGNELGNVGDLRGAEAEYRRALEISPSLRASWINLGNLLLKRGDFAEALAAYREAARIDPESGLARQGIGNVLKHLGDARAAIEEHRTAVRLDPADPKFHASLGAMLREHGSLEEGISELQEAVRLDPSYAMAHADLGIALGEKGDRDAGRRHLEEALRLDPKRAEAHNGLGHLARDVGDAESAASAYRKAIELMPQAAEFRANLANALRMLGDLEGAMAEVQKALALNPRHARAHTSLGNLLHVMGQDARAVEAHREAIRLTPEDALAHMNLAVALMSLDLDGAIASLREAVRLGPRIASTHGNLGAALAQKGAFDEAEREFRTAIALEPTNDDNHRNLGVVLLRRGRTDEAVTAFGEAVRTGPGVLRNHGAWVETLLRAGDYARASEGARRGLALAEEKASSAFVSHFRSLLRQAELGLRLPAVVAGTLVPADRAEGVAFAALAYAREQYALSARLYRDTLAKSPPSADEPPGDDRYNAACSAALAGSGRGKDAGALTDTERAAWRRQAVAWLREDLEAWSRRPETERDTVRKTLTHWKADTDLEGIRAPDVVSALPDEEERRAIRDLWSDVDRLLAGG